MRLLSVVLVVSGCVTTSAHEAKVRELDAVRMAHEKEAAQREAALQKKLAQLGHDVDQAHASTVEMTGQRDAVRKQLDDQIALLGELKKRLEKMGQNVDRLMSEKGSLASSLEDSKARL